jgi:hypothetical protein
MSSFPSRYIGDGVYASFDGYHIWVKTEREGMTHEIALEPEVYAALDKYKADITEALRLKREEQK